MLTPKSNQQCSNFRLKEIFSSLNPDLLLVEERVKGKIGANDKGPFNEIAHYLLALGGKRIRPLLALLCSRLFGMLTPSPALVDMAAGIEMIHMATLLHDDIIDHSLVRRNNLSVLAKFGLNASLLGGDFLFAKAFGLCANLDSFLINEAENACILLAEGELLEDKLRAERRLGVTEYTEIASRKTASLFALAAVSGTHLAKPDKVAISGMRDFGKYLGIAFQITDDILDVEADETTLGKVPGSDLRQRAPSLPNILWLAENSQDARTFFSCAEPNEDQFSKALSAIRSSSVLDRAKQEAARYSALARAELNKLDPWIDNQQNKDYLLFLTDFADDRTS